MKFQLNKYQDMNKCIRNKIPYIKVRKRRKYAFLSVDFFPCGERFQKILEDPKLYKIFEIRIKAIFLPTVERNGKDETFVGEYCSIDGIYRSSVYPTARKIINVYMDLLDRAERKGGI